MEQMDVLARELGAAIQQDARYTHFMAAKEQNDNDTALQELIGRFNLLRVSANAGEMDEAKLDELNREIRQVYAEIMQNPHMLAFNQAKAELDEMVNRVNTLILLCANGEDPATCEPSSCGGGDCSSCSGCH